MVLWTHRVFIQNGISIGSAVFARLKNVTNIHTCIYTHAHKHTHRPTDHSTPCIAIDRYRYDAA